MEKVEMDIKKATEAFWEQGFLVIEDFFSVGLMDRMNSMILDHFGMKPEWEHTDEFLTRSEVEVVPWFPYREGVTDNFDEVDNDPVFRSVSDSILGPGWRNLYCMAMFSKQGTRGQAWHQDCPPEDKERFNLNRLVYTHDVTPELGGGTLVVPGSHKKGEITTGGPHDAIEGQLTLYPKRGTLLFLHGHCWHRVLPVNGPYRVSTNFRAIPRDTPEDITDIAVYRNLRYRFSTHEVLEER